MGKPVNYYAKQADINSVTVDELADMVLEAYDKPNTLDQRKLLPRPSLNDIGQHRIASNQAGAAIQWAVRKRNGTPQSSYVYNTEDGISIGPTLATLGKQKLAKNDGKDADRRKYARELELLAKEFSPHMSRREITDRAGGKYEYINAMGNEAHHITPIGYMGKIMEKLEALNIDEPVIAELVRRKLSVGDMAQNLASLQTKAQPGRGNVVVQDKSQTTDKHDQVHALSEELLDILGLPRQNSGTYRLNDFMNDPNVTNYQRQAYGVAVPQAHRLAVQGVMLNPEVAANQRRLINGMIRLSADTQQAKMKLSPLSQQILREVHGQSF